MSNPEKNTADKTCSLASRSGAIGMIRVNRSTIPSPAVKMTAVPITRTEESAAYLASDMNIFRSSIPLLTIAACACCLICGAASGAETDGVRHLFDSDCGSALDAHERPVTDEQLCRVAAVPAPLTIGGIELLLCQVEPAAFDIGTQRQLFIDERMIDSRRGVDVVINMPVRFVSVLLTADEPWEEGARISVYSSVLRENGKTRIWYDLVQPTGDGPYDHQRRVCYAESEDGLHFVKPRVGLHEVNRSKDNNVVMPGVIGGCAVWIDPNADDEHRYKTQAKVYPTGQFHMHSSPDGLRWNKFARLDPGPGGWDTQSIVFWDPAIEKYALFTRFWTDHGDRERRYRTVRRLESTDLRSWNNQTIVMQPDDVDRATYETPTAQPPVDYYGASVFRYPAAEDVYIMLAQAFWHFFERPPSEKLGPSTFDVRLAVSRDGKNFARVGERRPFLSTGPNGRFDSRFAWALPNPVRMEDELWIYYVGSNRDHDGIVDPDADGNELSGIGRAVLRLDGFVSADAGYEGGELTTPLVTFAGDRLELNVDAGGGGSVIVELLDENGLPIDGFSQSDAVPVTGNSVHMPVSWKPGSDLRSLAGKAIRLRFHMRDCKLYAFQFRDG